MATTLHKPSVSAAASLLAPALLLAALVSAVGVRSGIIGNDPAAVGIAAPETVVVAPRTFSYRSPVDYLRNGFAVDAPMVTATADAPLEIMKYQVTAADYARCVMDGACAATDPKAETPTGDVPATGISYDDAVAYARWLSERTGSVWRLPTAEQWAFAAGSRGSDDALGVDADSRNPALRWIADYEREAARKAARNPVAQPLGTFGENEFGVADLAGNVWEWTATCDTRVNVDGDGKVLSEVSACGIYLTEGKHRAPMSSFIRDPKSGGCSVGTPPDNLGFRLVRDGRWYAPLLRALTRGTAFES
ncbi:SUMF1/EgtB/PvdO family nonheme iron enzyme [Ciceribacter azotifigens]|uniref:SUMF1/EgtB/PvdO family nonheme iron enzyme n=1 Tax=Ciceribacter azotifigens TaxID=2069303 RepID=UPI003A85E21C